MLIMLFFEAVIEAIIYCCYLVFLGNFQPMPGVKAPGGLVTKGNTLGFETIRPTGGANLSQFPSSFSNLFSGVMQGLPGNASGMLNNPFLQCEYGSHALAILFSITLMYSLHNCHTNHLQHKKYPICHVFCLSRTFGLFLFLKLFQRYQRLR